MDNNPQDKWVLSNIVPKFLEAIKSSTTIQEEQIIISQLNKLLNNFEFRYNQIFEEKNKIARQINQNLQELIEKIKKDFNIQEEKNLAMKVGQSIQFKFATIGNKQALVVVTLQNPTGRVTQLKKQILAARSSLTLPNLKFNSIGKYRMMIRIGSVPRNINIVVSK